MDEVTAFRLDGHGLTARVRSLTEAAGRCPVQNSPPGSAGAALNARTRDASGVEDALRQDRSLLQAFAARGAPHIFPSAAVGTFLLGLSPETEEELLGYLGGARAGLSRVRLAATDLVELAADAATEYLDGRAVTKDELGRALGELLTDQLPATADRRAWRARSEYAAQQFLGESLVRFALPALSLRGLLCHGGLRGRSPLLRRTDQWLGRPIDTPDSPGLVRRFLRCYGPADPAGLAAWAGITRAHAERLFDTMDTVEYGHGLRIHPDDRALLASAPRPRVTRLLPPHDPYLHTPDRDRLVPDKSWQREIWRTVGNPGVVLHHGTIAGTWRPRKSGSRLDLTVELRATVPRRTLHGEAERLAAQRNCALGACAITER